MICVHWACKHIGGNVIGWNAVTVVPIMKLLWRGQLSLDLRLLWWVTWALTSGYSDGSPERWPQANLTGHLRLDLRLHTEIVPRKPPTPHSGSHLLRVSRLANPYNITIHRLNPIRQYQNILQSDSDVDVGRHVCNWCILTSSWRLLSGGCSCNMSDSFHILVRQR